MSPQCLPDLRLATGKVAGISADLWVVDFSSAGIASVAIAPGVSVGDEFWPRFFALRPLYNDLVTRLGVPLTTGSGSTSQPPAAASGSSP